MKDYYQILGVQHSATPEDIKKAYRKLAHKYHPDKGGGDEQKFKEINEAYQVLSDKDKKAQYDKFGRVFEGGAGFEPGFDFGQFWGKFGEESGFGEGREFEFDDIGEMFEDFFGFTPRAKKRDLKKGQDIEIDFEISLQDTLKNQIKEVFLYKYIICSRCQGRGAEPGTNIKECFSCRGSGEVQQIKKTFFGAFSRYIICPECKGEGQRPEKSCNVCKGEGRIKDDESIKVHIPAGVDSNQVIAVDGKGDAGKKGGRAGDLYVRILVKKHPIFTRKGDDLYISVSINFSQAVLGDEIEVPTLDGSTGSPQGDSKILLKVPEGTESSKVLRISGKGIPHYAGYGRGNLYVELIVKIPNKISKKQKELLEQLKKENL